MASPTPVRHAIPAPPNDPATPPPSAHPRSAKAISLHLAEMVVAMTVGMVVLHPAWMSVLNAVGAGDLMHHAHAGPLIMATNMTVAMSVWMGFRGHRRRSIAEMGAAMYLPTLALFVPFELDLMGASALVRWSHLLMLPAMAVAMLLRPHEHGHR